MSGPTQESMELRRLNMVMMQQTKGMAEELEKALAEGDATTIRGLAIAVSSFVTSLTDRFSEMTSVLIMLEEAVDEGALSAVIVGAEQVCDDTVKRWNRWTAKAILDDPLLENIALENYEAIEALGDS